MSWNEIKSRALTFSRTWADAAHEDSQAKPFWIAFFEIFGITDKRVATFELALKKLPGALAHTQFPTSSLADLYDPLTTSPALLKADAALDKAYEACGGPRT